MNNERRKRLATVAKQIDELPDLDDIRSELEDIKSEEEEALENMPESLKDGDRGQTAQAAIDAIQNALDMFDNFNVEELTGHIEEAQS